MTGKKLTIFLLVGFKLLYAQKPPLPYFDGSQYSIEKHRGIKGYDVSYPLAIDSLLFYISNAPYENGVKHFDNAGNTLYRIYQSTNKKNPIQHFNNTFKKIHEGPFHINNARDDVWFTSNDELSKDGRLTIKEAIKVNGDWQIKNLLLFDTLKGSCCHPFLSRDGLKLFFAADIKGLGHGGMDIYTAEKVDGKWVHLKNLGAEINTEKDEAFPGFDNWGNLTFMSNRREGNFDVYFFNNKTQKINSLSPPFNSPGNETGITYSHKENCWYISSDREEKNVIYKIKLLWPKTIPTDTVSEKKYCFEFKEESSVGLTDTAAVGYEWDFGDGSKSRKLLAEHCYQNPGTYTVLLNIIDKTTGILFFNQVNYELEVTDSFPLNTTVMNDSLRWIRKDNIDSVRRVYVAVDDIPLYAGIAKTIAIPDSWKVIKEYYWISKHGIQDTLCRIRHRTHTKKLFVDTILRIAQPPDLNFKIHIGGSDTLKALEGYKSILGDSITVYKTSDNRFHYFAGNFPNIDSTFNPLNKIKEKGFNESTIIAFNKDSLIKEQHLAGNLKNLSQYCQFLYTARYKPSKFTLEKEDKKGLKIIEKLKGQKQITIVIVSTTDPTGSVSLNQILSERRSDEVKKYLSSLGVPDKKIEIRKKAPCNEAGYDHSERASKIYITYEN